MESATTVRDYGTKRNGRKWKKKSLASHQDTNSFPRKVMGKRVMKTRKR